MNKFCCYQRLNVEFIRNKLFKDSEKILLINKFQLPKQATFQGNVTI